MQSVECLEEKWREYKIILNRMRWAEEKLGKKDHSYRYCWEQIIKRIIEHTTNSIWYPFQYIKTLLVGSVTIFSSCRHNVEYWSHTVKTSNDEGRFFFGFCLSFFSSTKVMWCNIARSVIHRLNFIPLIYIYFKADTFLRWFKLTSIDTYEQSWGD